MSEQLRWPLDNQLWSRAQVGPKLQLSGHVEFAKTKFEEDIAEG